MPNRGAFVFPCLLAVSLAACGGPSGSSRRGGSEPTGTTRLGAFDVTGASIDFAHLETTSGWFGYVVWLDVDDVRYSVHFDDKDHGTVNAIEVHSAGARTALGGQVGLSAPELVAQIEGLVCRPAEDAIGGMEWLGCTSPGDPAITYILDAWDLGAEPPEAQRRALAALPWVWVKAIRWDGHVAALHTPPIPPLDPEDVDGCARVVVVASACHLDLATGDERGDIAPLDHAAAHARCAAAVTFEDLPFPAQGYWGAVGFEEQAKLGCRELQATLKADLEYRPRVRPDR